MNTGNREHLLSLLMAIPLLLFVLVPPLRGPVFTLLAGLLALDAVAAVRNRNDARLLERIVALLRPVLMVTILAAFWLGQHDLELAMELLLLVALPLTVAGVALRVWQVRRAERTEQDG